VTSEPTPATTTTPTTTSTAAAEHLRAEVADRILTITIDRPEAKNALSSAMRLRLQDLCRDAEADDGVDVVILTAVDPVFCGGADVKEIAAHGSALPPTDPGAALRSITKPVIAAIGGACVTGGLELALSCDIVVATERARFADTHARLGVLPRWGMSALLPRAVGHGRAVEITGTGRWVGAEEALRIGVVHHLVPHDELGAHARTLALAFCAVDQRALRASIALYRDGRDLPLADALALEQERGQAYTVDLSAFGTPASRPPRE
jgi:enoyl-CoA hydratase